MRVLEEEWELAHLVWSGSNFSHRARAEQAIWGFITNPAGAAVVNSIGPIRRIVGGEDKVQPDYPVIVPGTAGNLRAPVQVQ